MASNHDPESDRRPSSKSGKNKTTSGRTKTPSGKSKTPSGKSKTPSGKSKSSSGRSKAATARVPSLEHVARVAEYGEADEVAVDDAATLALENAVKQTPWWALSLAFHALVLATLPFFIFSKQIFDRSATPTVIRLSAQHVTIPDAGPEKQRKLFDSVGLPTDPTASSALDEKPVVMPNAIDGDHYETDDGMDMRTARGESLDFTGWNPGESAGNGRKKGPAGTIDTIGIGTGGGSGGKYGSRTGGGRQNMIKKYKGEGSESAVIAGLRWLARHQSPDGHWDTEHFGKNCKNAGHCESATGEGMNEFDVGSTGLALLAFLGAGITPQQRQATPDPVTGQPLHFGDVVRKGLAWLIAQQHEDGSVGPGVGEMMYNHAIASLALSEAYGLTNAIQYRNPAQKAINFIHTAQNYNLGWRYTAHPGTNDTSVTGWCVMALKSAQISGLEVSQTSFEGAKAWVNRVTDGNGQTGYDKLGSGEIFVPGKNEQWAHHPSMTAVGMLCRIFIDKKAGDPALAKGAQILAEDPPKWDPKAARPTVDYYYWYYASLAMFQLEAPGGSHWDKWNKAMLAALIPNQHVTHDGCLDGSWDTVGVDRWGHHGGRVYGTAMNVLTLEVYYRYRSVFGKN